MRLDTVAICYNALAFEACGLLCWVFERFGESSPMKRTKLRDYHTHYLLVIRILFGDFRDCLLFWLYLSLERHL